MRQEIRMSSSEIVRTPCPHNHQHNFKQEIEESIRRCEQLLSLEPPVRYHPTCNSPEGKSSSNRRSSSKRSSRSSGKVSSGYSRAEPETKGADFDPEWRKNMGLLINLQDENVTTVTPIAGDEDIPLQTPLDEQGNPPDERVETEYNLSFDESKDSSVTDTIPQSISIPTRTVTRETRSDITSESDEWNYDITANSPSSSSSASGIASQSSSKSRPRSLGSKPVSRASSKSKSLGFSRSSKSTSHTSSKAKFGLGSATGSDISERVIATDPWDVELESDRYSDAASGSVTRSERELARSGQTRETGHEELLSHRTEGPYQVTTTRREEGGCELITTKRCAIFPRHRGSPTPPSSPHLSMKLSSPPKMPTSRTPKTSRAQQEHERTLQDAIAFTFNTPQKFNKRWEWVGECTGVRSNNHGDQGPVPHQEKRSVVKLKPRVRQSIESSTSDAKNRVEAKRQIGDFPEKKKKKKFGGRRKSPRGAVPTVQKEDGQDGTRDSSRKTKDPTARLHNLSKPRTDLYQKLAHTKAQLEEEHMSECYFKPRVGRKPDPQSQYSGPLISRITGIEKKADLRKRARKAMEKEELDECSFWPQINSNSEYLDMNNYKPIQERALEYQRRRDAKIAMARVIEDQEKGLTFRPEINPNSVKIFKQTGLETINIADRLTAVGLLPSSTVRPVPKNECTFTPEINSNTDIIIRASKMLEGCTPDFFSRQQVLLQRAEKKKKAKEYQLQNEFAFKPNIDSNTDAILKTSPIAETFAQPHHKRVDRLYQRDLERRQHIRRKISDAYYAQFTHHPSIDHTSRLLGRSSSAYDLYKNEKGLKLREQIKSVIEENFEKSHPFQPKMHRSRSVENIREDMKLIAHSPRRPSAKKMEHVLHCRRQFRLEKARVLEEMKMVRELEEFKECTFKPHVNRGPPKDQEPVVVKGLGRFLELQDLAKQMKKDQEEWERKIFYQHVYALPKRQYTIPKPFCFAPKVFNSYSRKKEENRSGCTVRFSFQNKVKEQSDFVDFYEASHPTPKNSKWKNVTRWLHPEEDPRFLGDGMQKELTFSS